MITALNAMVRDDPRAKGIDPQTLRRDGDLALLSEREMPRYLSQF
jgi:hypothetical protein